MPGVEVCVDWPTTSNCGLGISENEEFRQNTQSKKEIVEMIYLDTSPAVFAYVYPFSDIHVTPAHLLTPSARQLPASSRRRRWSSSLQSADVALAEMAPKLSSRLFGGVLR